MGESTSEVVKGDKSCKDQSQKQSDRAYTVPVQSPIEATKKSTDLKRHEAKRNVKFFFRFFKVRSYPHGNN